MGTVQRQRNFFIPLESFWHAWPCITKPIGNTEETLLRR